MLLAAQDNRLNTLRPRQNGRHFPDYIFKCFFLNENVWIVIKISLNFIPNGPINNIPALVQIMAWRRPGDKPLSEPMMLSLLMHICITRPQWVNKPTYFILLSSYDLCGVCVYVCSTVPKSWICCVVLLQAEDIHATLCHSACLLDRVVLREKNSVNLRKAHLVLMLQNPSKGHQIIIWFNINGNVVQTASCLMTDNVHL